MNIPNPKISLNQISMLERYQLKEAGIAKYLDLSDADRNYEILETLTFLQYQFLNRLYSKKEYKQIGKILLEQGFYPSSEYRDYLMELNN